VATENHQPVKGYSKGFVPSNPARELAAYDELPAPARRALDAAPMAFSAVEALEVYRKEGIMALMREIKVSEDLAYAAFEAETGVPRPTGELKRRKVSRAFA
jgi:hypothetical protein